MELEKMRQQLIALARETPPSEQVPYAFEKRIMANLRTAVGDIGAFWERALCKAAVSCATVVLLFCLFDYQTRDTADDLSTAIEDTVYAAVREGIADSL